jgi:hypothetical protein
MRRTKIWVAVLMLSAAGPALAQNVGGGVFPPNEVDQIKVDMAIEKGVKHLKGNNAAHMNIFQFVNRPMSHCELVAFTYVHADVPDSDADLKALIDDMLKRDLEATYCVSLQAMVLEEVERVKYQKRILQCAQFLVDNQSAQGFWGYGQPSIFVEDVAYEMPKRKDVASGGGREVGAGGAREFSLPQTSGARQKPPVKNKLKVVKKRDGQQNDNSNSQYATLGMRACHDAGIILPPNVIELSIKWFRDSQKDEKGAEEELIEGGVNGPEVAKGGTVASVRRKAMPQGWSYTNNAHLAYGSMTAGAIGSLAIWDYIKDNDDGKKKSWKTDKDIHEGLQWLNKHYSVTFNPGPYEHGNDEVDSQHVYYYYMYALERAGMVYGTEMIGTHKWYPEGAKELISRQKPDGSWGGGTVDTCFAILFLKRATRALGVATLTAEQMRRQQR